MELVILFSAIFLLLTVMVLKNLSPITRTAYEKLICTWTENRWYVLVALILYDNLGVKFSVEDDEPWFKKMMVISKDGKKVEEFYIDYNRRTLTEFEDKIMSISSYGMPSIGCPPFSTPKELEMKLEISGKKKLDKHGKTTYNIGTQDKGKQKWKNW